jgi:hypothetical protein
MSIFSSIGKALGKVAKKVVKSPALAMIPGPVGALAKLGVVGGGAAAAVKLSTSKALAVVPKVIPGKGLLKTGAAIAGGTIAGEAIYDAAGNLVGYKQRRRRMNPLNPKAARRAIRRVKSVRKMLHNIEKQLPKQKCTRRAA